MGRNGSMWIDIFIKVVIAFMLTMASIFSVVVIIVVVRELLRERRK